MPRHRWSIGLRAIAIFELFKGSVVLLAFAMVAAGHWSMPGLMGRLAHVMHLKPGGQAAVFLTHTVGQLEMPALVWLALGYVSARFAEAYGLWAEKHWGEWLAILSAGLYVPAEICEIWLHASWRKAVVLGINLVIIAFLGWVLWRTRRRSLAKSSRDAETR